MTRKIPILLPEGEIIVARRISTFTWGVKDIDIPTELQDETASTLQQYKKPGYVYDELKQQGENRSLFNLMGSRADTSEKIVLDASKNPSLELGESTTEQVIADAIYKSGEEVLFSKEVDDSALGIYQPGADFNIGSPVDAIVWGKKIPTYISGITRVTEQGSAKRWQVKIGGSLLIDEKGLGEMNADIDRRITEENRQLMQAIAEGKLKTDEIIKFLGIGDGTTSTKTVKEMIGDIERITTTISTNYENLQKDFVTVQENKVKDLEKKVLTQAEALNESRISTARLAAEDYLNKHKADQLASLSAKGITPISIKNYVANDVLVDTTEEFTALEIYVEQPADAIVIHTYVFEDESDGHSRSFRTAGGGHDGQLWRQNPLWKYVYSFGDIKKYNLKTGDKITLQMEDTGAATLNKNIREVRATVIWLPPTT